MRREHSLVKESLTEDRWDVHKRPAMGQYISHRNISNLLVKRLRAKRLRSLDLGMLRGAYAKKSMSLAVKL